MELVYLWLKDSHVFADHQEFHFGGKYWCHYDRKSETLEIKENPSHIEGFFNPGFSWKHPQSTNAGQAAWITNVTAIIGQNGAGKTSLLDFIKEQLVYGGGGIESEAIIVLMNREGELLIYYPEERSVAVEAGSINTIRKPYGIIENGDIRTYPEITELSETTVLYCSPVFDNKLEGEHGNLFNLSTNYLSKADKKNMLENNPVLEVADVSDIEIHRLEELRRQIVYVNHVGQDAWLPFEAPKQIYVSSVKTPGTFGLINAQYAKMSKQLGNFLPFVREAFHHLDQVVSDYKQAASTTNRGHRWKGSQFLVDFYRSLLINFFYEVNQIGTADEKHFAEQLIQDREEAWNDLESESVEPIDDMTSFMEAVFEGMSLKIERATKIMEVIRLLRDIPERKINYDGVNLSLDVNSTSDLSLTFSKFYEAYSGSFIINPYLNFQWRNLSSGQKALLSLFARLYSLVDEDRFGGSPLKDDIILLVDEGDLYLHPQWQKQLLDKLLLFLSKTYQGSRWHPRRIQVILTSNAPFLASDLPKSNVIFLQRTEEQSKTAVADLDLRKRTFAANIHSLYSDAFFISDGLIGDFAKKHINDLIDVLLQEESASQVREHRDLFEKVIDFVGEQVVHTKLRSLFREQLRRAEPPKNASLEEQIQELEQQLQRLREQANHDKDQ